MMLRSGSGREEDQDVSRPILWLAKISMKYFD